MDYPAPATARWARSSPACSMSIRRPSDLHHYLGTAEKPLNAMNEADLCPGSAALDKLNAALR